MTGLEWLEDYTNDIWYTDVMASYEESREDDYEQTQNDKSGENPPQ